MRKLCPKVKGEVLAVLDVPIYPAVVNLHFGKDVNEICEHYGYGDKATRIACCGQNGQGHFAVVFSRDQIDPGIVAHEVFHLTFHIMDYIGAGLCEGSNECYAALNDTLTSWVYNVAAAHKIKIVK